MINISSSSTLEQEFLDYLKNDNIKVITFDIFETICFRKVGKPFDIFKEIGKREYTKKYFDNAKTFQNYRLSAEKNARINKENTEDINIEDIYSYLPLNKNIKKRLINLELKEENNQIFINKQLDKWIKLAKKYNKKVILISDMYLSKRQIEKIVISKLSNKKCIDDIYVSNEIGVTKYTSNLFKKVKEDMGINYAEQLHIGDNIKSDNLIPRSLGINTLYYNLDKNQLKSFELEYKYLENKVPRNNNIRVLAALENNKNDKKNRFFFNLGATIYGPLLWEFSSWINDICIKNNIAQVAFLMREGRIFKKFFEKLNINNLDTKLIYASRASTYLSSIDINEFKKKSINFYQFRMFKILDFYKKFKIDIKNEIVWKYKDLYCFEAEHKIINNQNILEYVSNDFFTQIDIIERNIVNEKIIIKKYLKSLRIKKDSLIIDFGGGGSIIKRLCSLDNKMFKMAGLFYMHNLGYEIMPKTKQLSFLTYNKGTEKFIEYIRRSPEFTEILFNGAEQTTSTYEYINNIPTAILSDKNSLDLNIIESFDLGIESFFNTAFKYKKKNLFRKKDLLKILSRLIEVPTKDESRYLGDLDFELGAGSSEIFQLLESKLDINDLNSYYISYLNNINIDRDKLPWINGLITRKDEKLIQRTKGYLEFGEKGSGINQIINQIKDLDVNELYIYGAGIFFETLYSSLKPMNLNIPYLIDARANYSEYEFMSYKVKTLKNSKLKNNATIVIASGAYIKDIVQNIKEYANTKNINITIISIFGIEKI